MSKKGMFVDRVSIKVIAGKGGDGASHFRREKFVPLGGPDGGDGGRGGSIILEVDEGLKTLVDFYYRQEYKADAGKPGRGAKKYGKHGEDSIIKVPLGTVVMNAKGEVIADLSEAKQSVCIARGGRGGRGNVHFATALRRAPKLAEKGEPGKELDIILELKLLAEVGIMGLPNAGKSTLLSVVSSSRPKIANYPFTTLIPNLGQVKLIAGQHFAMVDIPGLIAGAAQGQGLGHEFLRHIERTKLLLHLLDVGFPGTDPIQAFNTLNKELALYNQNLLKRQQIVVLNKVDLLENKQELKKVVDYFEEKKYKIFIISAVTRKGVSDLLTYIGKILPQIKYEPLFIPKVKKVVKKIEPRFKVEKIEAGKWRIMGKEVEKWVAMTDFNNEEAVNKLRYIMDKIGVSAECKKQEVRVGDVIVVGREEFTYQE